MLMLIGAFAELREDRAAGGDLGFRGAALPRAFGAAGQGEMRRYVGKGKLKGTMGHYVFLVFHVIFSRLKSIPLP